MQTIGARFAHGEITLEQAAELGCRACASPGGGCQFLGTAATSQVVGEALGLSLPHSALAPSGQPIWLDMARRSARRSCDARGARASRRSDILTDAAFAQRDGRPRRVRRLDEPAPAHAGHRLHAPGCARPTVDDWTRVNRQVPRLVDALPNGPVGHPTVRVFLAGGVPGVMLHLRELGLLDLDALTVTGEPLGDVLDWWETVRAPPAAPRRCCASATASIPTTSS